MLKKSHLHAHGFPHVRAFHLLPLYAKNGEACEFAVLVKVSDKVLHDIDRDDIANVLNIFTLHVEMGVLVSQLVHKHLKRFSRSLNPTKY